MRERKPESRKAGLYYVNKKLRDMHSSLRVMFFEAGGLQFWVSDSKRGMKVGGKKKEGQEARHNGELVVISKSVQQQNMTMNNDQ